MAKNTSYFLLVLVLFLNTTLFAQQHEVIELKEKPTVLNLSLFKSENLPDYDQLSVEVKDKEIYLFFSQGRKLFLRYSDDEGVSWKEDFLTFYTHPSNESFPLKVVRTSNGFLHLFFFELTDAEKKLNHWVRTDPSLDWFPQVLKSTPNISNTNLDFALQEDCNFNLFVAFHLGENEIHQAEYKGLKWLVSSFRNSTKDVGLSITSGFDRDLHIALAENKGSLKVATRYLQNNDWDIQRIGESGQKEVSICKTADGGLMVATSAFVAGTNKPLLFYRFSPKTGWSSFQLKNNDSADFTAGAYKSIDLVSDQSGRLHVAAYLVDYKTESRKSLSYLYSNNNGKTWYSQTLRTDVTGYSKKNKPHIVYNDKIVFVGYKTANRQIGLLQYKGVNLKGIPQCMIRKDDTHTVTKVEKETKSRIVQTIPKANDPILIPNPNTRALDVQAEFITNDATLSLILKDYREVDGDTISVFLNGVCVLHRYGLRAKAQTITLKIDPKEINQVLIYAESEGSRPPCTAALSLRNKTRKQDYIIQSSMSSNGAITLRPSR